MADELMVRLEKGYPNGPVIQADFTLGMNADPITVLFGPTGSGKTTILRCIAGLERPDAGQIRYRGELFFDDRRKVFVPPQKRHIGFLFQDYALFPHRTVLGNLAYGLTHLSAAERRERIKAAVEFLQLEGLEQRYPRQLSGGQQQRVALARTLVVQPRLLLLDEPLSALDTPTREPLRTTLRHWLKRLGIPAILVTHDRDEALAIADRCLILAEGRIRQIGAVREVFTHPCDSQVARIVGMENVIAGTVIGVEEGLASVKIGSTILFASVAESIRGEVFVCIRAEDVILEKTPTTKISARNQPTGRVTACEPSGPMVRVTVDCGFPLTALITRQAKTELEIEEGAPITAVVKAASIRLIPRED